MTLQEIKDAVNAGKVVHWANSSYIVMKDSIGQFLIYHVGNRSSIGLTWRDGVTMNGKPEDFYIEGEE